MVSKFFKQCCITVLRIVSLSALDRSQQVTSGWVDYIYITSALVGRSRIVELLI